MTPITPNLTRKEASQHLHARYGINVSPKTLASYACDGGGPEFYKALHVVLYPVSVLDRWAVERLGELRASTSDAAQDAPSKNHNCDEASPHQTEMTTRRTTPVYETLSADQSSRSPGSPPASPSFDGQSKGHIGDE